MKRISHLYERLSDLEFIKECIGKAARYKKKRKGVMRVLKDPDFYAKQIQDMVLSHDFSFKPTHNRTIPEYRKKREITISPFFPNQILDYMLVESLKPHIKKSLYEYAVGNVDGKGIKYGKDYLYPLVKRHAYFLKLDIRHFYQSVKPSILMEKLERRIKDKAFLDFARQTTIRFGFLPIGAYYSQWLSNFFLLELDYFIKQKLNIPVYVRYVDDMLLLADNREQLEEARKAIAEELGKIGLALKHAGDIRPTDNSISFLGFRFKKEKIFLRSRIIYRLQKVVKKAKVHVSSKICKRIIAFTGWLKNIPNGYAFYKERIYSIIRQGYARRIISEANQNPTPRQIQWQKA